MKGSPTHPHELSVPLDAGAATTALVYAGEHPAAALILAHGAGAGQRHPFMVEFAYGIAALGIDVVTFNFAYTEAGRRVPDRAPALEACYRRVIEAVRDRVGTARQQLFIGGKSMGGRIATQVAAADPELPVAGLVLLGYPLHPPGRPEQRRDAHLPAVGRPMLFVQGGRDAFGTPAELAPVVKSLTPPSSLHIVEGGDHSFKMSRKDREAQARVYRELQRTIAEWIGETSRSSGRAPHR
jgi:predicted alpha/beta-hydrolase family hydrolase